MSTPTELLPYPLTQIVTQVYAKAYGCNGEIAVKSRTYH